MTTTTTTSKKTGTKKMMRQGDDDDDEGDHKSDGRSGEQKRRASSEQRAASSDQRAASSEQRAVTATIQTRVYVCTCSVMQERQFRLCVHVYACENTRNSSDGVYCARTAYSPSPWAPFLLPVLVPVPAEELVLIPATTHGNAKPR